MNQTVVSSAFARIESLRFTGGMVSQSFKFALPGGPNRDADRNPTPLVDIANASVVLNITQIEGLSNATVTYGNYGASESFAVATQPPPKVGTLLVVEGQRVSFATSREATGDEGTITISAELIGDFCKRAPSEKICQGHNEKATSPPMSSSAPSNTTSPASGNSSASQETQNATTAPPTPAPTKSASPRRLVLSAVVACLAISVAVM